MTFWSRGRYPLIVGLLGAAGIALGAWLDPRQAWLSYLAAFAAGLSLALGALILVMICDLTGARWVVPFRPTALAVLGSLPVFGLLFLPLLAARGELYPMPTGAADPRRVWLEPAFFLLRAVLYFAVWIAVATLLRRWDSDRRGRVLSAVALPAVGITLTFAAFDWLMSLSPGWVSTIYGVYWFAGGFLAALALLAITADNAAPSAVHALGNLLLTFVVFWAYVGFCQYLIIWIGDIPAEVTWYLVRARGSWGDLAVVLLLGQFLVPFLLLLFRSFKLEPRAVAVLGYWLLLIHYLDNYWLILPEAHPSGLHPSWLDVAAIATVGGFGIGLGSWVMSRGSTGVEARPAGPMTQDPRPTTLRPSPSPRT